MTGAEEIINKGMILRNDDDQVDIPVFCELVNCFEEIAHTDEIEFRIEFGEQLLHFSSFCKVFFGE